MGWFRKKEVRCPAGEWTTLIRNFAARMPASWTITFRAADGAPVDGHYEEKRSWWIFPQRAETGHQIVFEWRWINTMYSLKVRPTVDIAAEID